MELILNKKQQELIRNYTLLEYPREMCGFLTQDSFLAIKNIAENPETNIKISEMAFYNFRKEAIAVVHSHTLKKGQRPIFDVRTPSYLDAKNQKISGLPWLIVGTEGLNVTNSIQYPRVRNNSYLDRSFIWFIYDCFTLVQDFYFYELGIELSDIEIPEDYKSYRAKDNLVDYFMEQWPIRLEKVKGELKENDVVLLDGATGKRNHLGIYTNGTILHQLTRSIAEPYENFKGRIKEKFVYLGEIA